MIPSPTCYRCGKPEVMEYPGYCQDCWDAAMRGQAMSEERRERGPVFPSLQRPPAWTDLDYHDELALFGTTERRQEEESARFSHGD